MGQSLISYRGEGWHGKTSLTTNDRGDRRLVKILNGYVSADGSEIRSFPGWRTLIDLSEENNPDGGYSRYVIDAMRPVMEEPSPGQFYVDPYMGGDSRQQTLYARAKPIWLEAFEQVGDSINIMGISRFREAPIYTAARQKVSPTGISTDETKSDKIVISLDGSIGGYSSTDATGPGLNGLFRDQVVYLEGLTSDDPSVATLLAQVNNRAHIVDNLGNGAIPENFIRLKTQGAISTTSAVSALTAGEVHQVRGNRNNTYPTPTGVDPFDSNAGTRIDDWNALTNWKIVPNLPLELTNAASHICHPAWVANRQRDFEDDQGDYTPASGAFQDFTIEGIGLEGTSSLVPLRGVSKREQRELQYRIVPEPAGDRIIIAAPGYNCLFQIPLQIPFNPDNWPASPTNGTLGVHWFGNDIYDKPRALGVPKCRLIDCPKDTAPPSPDQNSSTGAFTHLVTALDSSPAFGFPPGTYRMVATYEDEITGEEGEPSEVIEVTVPANDYAYVINVRYFHPGYIMPECLAFRLNVYLSAPNGDALGFYRSFPLNSSASHSLSHLGFAYDGVNGMNQVSAKYGFNSGASPDNFTNVAEWRTLVLPLPTRNTESSPGTGDFDLGINFFRPPVASGMPRGASFARFIRGVMIAGGHLGLYGPTKNLYRQSGSIILDATAGGHNDEPNQILTRIHDANWFDNADGQVTDGFGLAGRSFPDSCQGINGISEDLIPSNIGRAFQIDRVLNRIMITPNSDGHRAAAWERIQTVDSVVDLNFTTSPADPEFVPVAIYNKTYYLRMFKGQLQVADPGEPSKVVKAGDVGIKFVDPNKDDDIVAGFQMAGNAVICSRKETFFFSWARSAGGETPTTVSTEHGCIAPNSMVEFDGGVAWISERGPVALGASLQFVGGDIQQDFVGQSKRYATDVQGMMRHTWACHDSARNIVMWGMVTQDATHSVNDGRGGVTFVGLADDGVFSRMPCDEVLIWSYRTNSFSTWRPPAGMEIMWMRQIMTRHPISSNSSTVSVAFLAVDGRIYTLDDTWSDCNDGSLVTSAATAGTNSTTMTVFASQWGTDGVANGGPDARSLSTVGNGSAGFFVRAGHIVQALGTDNAIEWETTIVSADPATNTIVLAEAQTWPAFQGIRIGVRPAMVIETTFAGGQTQNIESKAIQVRYTLHGNGVQLGSASVKAVALKSDLLTEDEPQEVQFFPEWVNLGATQHGRHGRRRQIEGDVTAPEIAIRLTVTSDPQVRIADIMLEV